MLLFQSVILVGLATAVSGYFNTSINCYAFTDTARYDFEGSEDDFLFDPKYVEDAPGLGGGQYSLRVSKGTKRDLKSDPITFDRYSISHLSISFDLYGRGMDASDVLSFRYKFDTDPSFKGEVKYKWGKSGLANKVWVTISTGAIEVPTNAASIQLRFTGTMNKKKESVFVDNLEVHGVSSSDNATSIRLYGVEYDVSTTSSLGLSGDGLSGTIPTSIACLTGLTSLSIYNNPLTGTLPTELCSLSLLRYFDFESCLLTGSIPTHIGRLTELTTMYANRNKFTGTIPTQIGRLTNLSYSYFGANYLSGSIPTEFGFLDQLNYLSLYDNELTGSIPTEIGTMTELDTIVLYSNELTGSIPTEIGFLTDLDNLYLGGNKLTSIIPTEIGNLTDLDRLSLYDNELTGSIPTHIGFLTDLDRLVLYGNKLTSIIPTEIGTMTDLDYLYLHDNLLTGSIPTELLGLPSLDNFTFFDTFVTVTDPPLEDLCSNGVTIETSGSELSCSCCVDYYPYYS